MTGKVRGKDAQAFPSKVYLIRVTNAADHLRSVEPTPFSASFLPKLDRQQVPLLKSIQNKMGRIKSSLYI